MSLFIRALIALVAIVITYILYADRRFNEQVEREVKTLFNRANTRTEGTFDPDSDLRDLPELMQHYLRKSIPTRYPYIHSMRLKQEGTFATAPGAAWMPFVADQYFTVDPPGLIWSAKVYLQKPLAWIRVRDKYLSGAGNMYIRPWSAVTIGDDSGDKIDNGAFIRWMGEAFWFPTSVLSLPGTTWETLDEKRVKITMTDQAITASLILHFDENGDICYFESNDRYMGNDAVTPTHWFARVHRYATFDGVRIPSQIDVGWTLDSGEYIYWRGTITAIDYNTPKPYA